MISIQRTGNKIGISQNYVYLSGYDSLDYDPVVSIVRVQGITYVTAHNPRKIGPIDAILDL